MRRITRRFSRNPANDIWRRIADAWHLIIHLFITINQAADVNSRSSKTNYASNCTKLTCRVGLYCWLRSGERAGYLVRDNFVTKRIHFFDHGYGRAATPRVFGLVSLLLIVVSKFHAVSNGVLRGESNSVSCAILHVTPHDAEWRKY